MSKDEYLATSLVVIAIEVLSQLHGFFVAHAHSLTKHILSV
jgi:hypothetical protein